MSSTFTRRWRERSRLRLESLEARELLAFDPSPMEQEMLEHLNRMRMDPQGELDVLFSSHPNPLVARDSSVQNAISYFGVDGNLLQSQWASLTAAPPLAWNSALQDAATSHNQLMIQYNQQSHQLPGEASLLTRIVDAGYNWSGSVGVGENVFAFATSVMYAHAGFAIDWGSGPGGIQSGAGHRVNMMRADYQEVGIAITAENNPSTQVGPLLVTQDFGRRGNYGQAALLGVVYWDTNGDGRYQAGEQRSGVQISASGSAGTFTTTTMTAGGYQMKLPAGTYTVTASGGLLEGPMVVSQVVVGSTNVKVDFRANEAEPEPDPEPDPVTVDGVGVQRGTWFFRDVNTNGAWDADVDVVSAFGATGDIAIAGDWNGDGVDEIGTRRGAWFYLDYNGSGGWNAGDVAAGFGLAGDTPLVGDWDGDGTDQIGVWRSGVFYLDMDGNFQWNSGDVSFKFGLTTDKPLAGDWDGDGRDQVGVKRGSTYYWDYNNSRSWNTGDVVFTFGLSGDTPLVGDWDGDGQDQIGVWRSGTFYLDLNGNRGWDAGDQSFRFGLGTDKPFVGRWASSESVPPPAASLSISAGAESATPVAALAAGSFPADDPPPLGQPLHGDRSRLAAVVDHLFADRTRSAPGTDAWSVL